MVDASAAMSALLNDGPARHAMSTQQLHAPHLIDSEVANGLRRRVAAEQMRPAQGAAALGALAQLGMTRYPVFAILDRIWQLRDNLSAYDASYLALAEALRCGLLTADGRLARAPGVNCSVTVVPR